ncbi:MAG: hypothetical protein KC731_32685, partial [Myxococcales bacterium]|nr:hypothetical protein [Myxococcales bacterium]
MSSTHGQWLRNEMNAVWNDPRLLDEPAARVALWMHALVEGDGVDNVDNPLLDVQLPESDHNPGATGSRPPTQPEIRQPPPKTISRLPGLISKVAA